LLIFTLNTLKIQSFNRKITDKNVNYPLNYTPHQHSRRRHMPLTDTASS
jgi:hypothetical protein